MECPNVSPAKAVRSLGRVAYWAPSEYARNPGVIGSEPRHQYQRVVSDLVGLLNDRRVIVSDAAADWLGASGGYDDALDDKISSALETYRQAVAAQPNATEKEQRIHEMRLLRITQSQKDVKMKHELRIKSAATQSETPTMPGADRP